MSQVNEMWPANETDCFIAGRMEIKISCQANSPIECQYHFWCCFLRSDPSLIKSVTLIILVSMCKAVRVFSLDIFHHSALNQLAFLASCRPTTMCIQQILFEKTFDQHKYAHCILWSGDAFGHGPEHSAKTCKTVHKKVPINENPGE